MDDVDLDARHEVQPARGSRAERGRRIRRGVCDPSGGYSFTQNTLDNFGKINLKRGHRVIELVVKYYF